MKANRFCTALLTATIAGTIMTAPCNPFNATHANAVSVPSTSRIKDLNEDGVLDLFDAMHLMEFLEGKLDYPYVYDDMDATADYVVDQADAQAYLAYYNYYRITVGSTAPFSAHGALRFNVSEDDPNYEAKLEDYLEFENRSYTAYSHTTHTTRSYTLTNESLAQTDYANYDELLAKLNNQSVNSRAMTQVNDSRLIRIGEELSNSTKNYLATGFIVGDHVIATAAHCLYNRNIDPNTNQHKGFNRYKTAYAYTYENNTQVEHKLTIKSVHIPTAFITGGNDVGTYWDYGLIVVEEDLSGYGYFPLGMLLDDSQSTYLTTSSKTVTTAGFRNGTQSQYMKGALYQLTPAGTGIQQFIYGYGVRNALESGMSGSVSYLAQSDGYGDTAVGVYTSNGSITAQGMAITRPLLQFYLNNGRLNS
ncbi:MAG: trypsin-like serine protease [Ruminococcus sp.]|nr:trypsin-like serine protease [Ruminococcus sp.]